LSKAVDHLLVADHSVADYLVAADHLLEADYLLVLDHLLVLDRCFRPSSSAQLLRQFDQLECL